MCRAQDSQGSEMSVCDIVTDMLSHCTVQTPEMHSTFTNIQGRLSVSDKQVWVYCHKCMSAV